LFIPPLIGLQAAMPVKDMATSSTMFDLFWYTVFLFYIHILTADQVAQVHHRCLRWAGNMVWGNTPRANCSVSYPTHVAVLQVLRQRLSKISGLRMDLSGAALANSARQIQSIEVKFLVSFLSRLRFYPSKARVAAATIPTCIHKKRIRNMARQRANYFRVLRGRFGLLFLS
jgi:hypothetical protein